MNFEPDREKNGTPTSPAIALASNVFPVLGGPTKRTPFGIFAPTAENFSGVFKNSTTSWKSCLASSTPSRLPSNIKGNAKFPKKSNIADQPTYIYRVSSKVNIFFLHFPQQLLRQPWSTFFTAPLSKYCKNFEYVNLVEVEDLGLSGSAALAGLAEDKDSSSHVGESMEEGMHKDDKISTLNKPLIIVEKEEDGDISQNSGNDEEHGNGHGHGTASFVNTCFNGVNALSELSTENECNH
ncbi:hypothetical protein AHAS_Ahas14G0225500 [Arachis hypogaea]